MSKVLISYDLNQPGRDYAHITERIKALGAASWCHPLESVWLIITAASAAAVRDDLQNYADASSKLLVIDVTGDAMAWAGIADEAADWLRAN